MCALYKEWCRQVAQTSPVGGLQAQTKSLHPPPMTPNAALKHMYTSDPHGPCPLLTYEARLLTLPFCRS